MGIKNHEKKGGYSHMGIKENIFFGGYSHMGIKKNYFLEGYSHFSSEVGVLKEKNEHGGILNYFFGGGIFPYGN